MLGCETTRRTLGRLMAGRYTVVPFRYTGHTPFLPRLSDALQRPKNDSFLVPKRILIADDHLAVREGLRSLIDPDPDFKVVGEAADGNEAARKALELRPDVIMLDNSMPGMTGLEVARMLRDNLPQTKIVFLTLDPGIRDLALATGAAAHISKDQPPQEIMRVVRAAAGISAPTVTSHALSAQAKLAELLVTEKNLSARQVQDLDSARESKQTLSNALLRSGLVADEALAAMLARVSARMVVSLANAPEAAVVRQLPRRFCELRALVLTEFGRTSATLAMADPLDAAAEREAKDMLGGIELKVVIATLTDVRESLRRAYAPATVPLVAVPHVATPRRSRRPFVLAGAIAAAFLLFATGLGVLLSQGTAVAARANLTVFQGSVDVRHGSGAFAAATSNELVQQGDAIRTAVGAHAALTFFENSVVVLEPETQVELATLRTVSGGRDIDLLMRQTTGKTWHVVAHAIGEGGHYAVVTPTSTNTVQGMAFQVRVDAQGDSSG